MEKTLWLLVAEPTEDRFEMLLFVMILWMGSFDIKNFIKKPAFIATGVIIVLIILLIMFMGRGSGQDPTVKSLKNLSNRHQALITLIDQYSGGVRSATFKANLSQVSIILTADKNDIDSYTKTINTGGKKVTATLSAKPSKDLTQKLDKAEIANNLDSELKAVVDVELNSIGSAVEKVKKSSQDNAGLRALADKLILNTQTMLTRLNEG